jgi:hypothetical protein
MRKAIKISLQFPDSYGHIYQSARIDDTILVSEENINSIELGRKEVSA